MNIVATFQALGVNGVVTGQVIRGTISGMGPQGPAIPLVQTVRPVGQASATAAPCEAAVAAALAANRLIPGDDGRFWTLAATAAGKAVLRRVVSLLCLLSVVSVMSVLSVSQATAATEDEELISVDPDTRETDQAVDFRGSILVPTPTSTGQAANALYADQQAAAAQAAAIAAAALDATSKSGTAESNAKAASTPVSHATDYNNPHLVTAAQVGAQALVTFSDSAVGVPLQVTSLSYDLSYRSVGVFRVSSDTAASALVGLMFYAHDSMVGQYNSKYLYSRVCTKFANQYVIWRAPGMWKMALTTDSTSDYFATSTSQERANGTYVGNGIYAGRTLTVAMLFTTGSGSIGANSAANPNTVNPTCIGGVFIPTWATKLRVIRSGYSGAGVLYVVLLKQGFAQVEYTRYSAVSGNYSEIDIDISPLAVGCYYQLFIGCTRYDIDNTNYDTFGLLGVTILK